MSAIIADVLEGCVTPDVAGAAVGAGKTLLKAVDMQRKYGQMHKGVPRLALIGSGDANGTQHDIQRLQAELADLKKKTKRSA
jgi:hypothetical protein